MAENGSNRKVYVVTTGTPDVNTAIGGEMSNSLTVNGVIIDVIVTGKQIGRAHV